MKVHEAKSVLEYLEGMGMGNSELKMDINGKKFIVGLGSPVLEEHCRNKYKIDKQMLCKNVYIPVDIEEFNNE